MVKQQWSSDHNRLNRNSSSNSGCSSKTKKMNKGAWTAEEDNRLADYVKMHGEKKWTSVPAQAGLNRCGKSCRLRWLNYLKPGIKRGNISEDEEDLIIRLHNLIGNRWALIAGRLPGRTDNEIKNHWNTYLSKKCLTINQLNWKLNHSNQMSNDPSPTLIAAANGSDLAAPPRNEIFQPSCDVLQMQLAGRSEQQDDGDVIDVDGLLEVSSLVPDVAESEPFKVEQHGSEHTLLEQQLACNQLDLERLVRWLEHEDDVFAFLSQVWQP